MPKNKIMQNNFILFIVSNTQETSADWKPSYCNVSYDADSEILNVNFEAAPERFKFNQFNVIVTNLANFKHTHSHINQVFSSFFEFNCTSSRRLETNL